MDAKKVAIYWLVFVLFLPFDLRKAGVTQIETLLLKQYVACEWVDLMIVYACSTVNVCCSKWETHSRPQQKLRRVLGCHWSGPLMPLDVSWCIIVMIRAICLIVSGTCQGKPRMSWPPGKWQGSWLWYTRTHQVAWGALTRDIPGIFSVFAVGDLSVDLWRKIVHTCKPCSSLGRVAHRLGPVEKMAALVCCCLQSPSDQGSPNPPWTSNSKGLASCSFFFFAMKQFKIFVRVWSLLAEACTAFHIHWMCW